MRPKAVDVPIAEPDEGSLELTEQIIRARAYRFYEERGQEDGHDLEDWFRAEAEIAGKKPATEEKDTERRITAAAS